MDLIQLAGVIILAAAVGEGVVEFVVSPLLDLVLPNDSWANRPLRTVIFNCLSALLGVGIAVNFRLGLFSLLGASGAYSGLDLALTGILMGRGSNYIHAFVKTYILDK